MTHIKHSLLKYLVDVIQGHGRFKQFASIHISIEPFGRSVRIYFSLLSCGHSFANFVCGVCFLQLVEHLSFL